jgi:hypothetical protein
MCRSLRLLDATGLHRLTNVGVAQLAVLVHLAWLSLAGCSALTSEALASLQKLPDLAYLSLKKCAAHLPNTGMPSRC